MYFEYIQEKCQAEFEAENHSLFITQSPLMKRGLSAPESDHNEEIVVIVEAFC